MFPALVAGNIFRLVSPQLSHQKVTRQFQHPAKQKWPDNEFSGNSKTQIQRGETAVSILSRRCLFQSIQTIEQHFFLKTHPEGSEKNNASFNTNRSLPHINTHTRWTNIAFKRIRVKLTFEHFSILKYCFT